MDALREVRGRTQDFAACQLDQRALDAATLEALEKQIHLAGEARDAVVQLHKDCQKTRTAVLSFGEYAVEPCAWI